MNWTGLAFTLVFLWISYDILVNGNRTPMNFALLVAFWVNARIETAVDRILDALNKRE